MIALLTTALAGGLPSCAESPDAEASAELATLFAQAESTPADAPIKPVLKKVKKGTVCTAEDHFHAAFVLMNSKKADDLKVAYELAQLAATAHVDRAKWLTTVSFDRWQLALGNPQRYGTQTGRGGRCLFEIDETVDDAMRTGWGADPLRTTYAKFLASQDLADKEPNATTVNNLGLFCPSGSW